MIASPRRHALAHDDVGTVDRENPWPGLAAFREEDRDFFHGRAAAIEELHRRVCRERLTVLYGLSGLGKSSLLGAGLFPRLRLNGFLPVLVRLDYTEGAAEPVTQVREALLREAAESGVEMPPWRAGDSLWEYLHRPALELWSSRNRLVTPVLVFDQFEEIFTLGRSRPDLVVPRRRFLDELGDLVEGRPPARVRERLESDPEEASEYDFHRHPYKVLLALREDFLADLEELRRRMPSLAHNRMRLQRMTGENALSVVLGAGGHLVKPDVAEQIVRFVAAARTTADRALAELTVEPALLSVVCRELNLRRRQRGEDRITSDLLKGDREEILWDFYERGVADLPPAGRRFLEDRLLTASGFRDSVAVEDALEADGLDREALDRLVAARLLRREERGGVPRLELTHDRLTDVVRASRDRRREREAREAAVAAKREAEGREEIAAAKLRRSRVTSAVLAASLLLAVAAGIWAVVAEKGARQARINTLFGTAKRYAEEGTNTQAESLAYLASVLRLDPGHRPARRMLDDLLLDQIWSYPRLVLRHDDAVASAVHSDDGSVVATRTRSGTVQVWDGESGERVGSPIRHGDRIVALALSRDGKTLATGDVGGIVRLWRVETATPIGRPLRHDSRVLGMSLTRDGERLVTGSRDGAVWIWDASTAEPIGGSTTHDDHMTIFFPSEGDRLVTASANHVVRIWDTRTGAQVGEPIRDPGNLLSVALSPDGARLLVITSQAVRLWDAERGELEVELHPDLPDWAGYGRFSPDGSSIAFTNPDGRPFLWDLTTGEQSGFSMPHGADITSLEFSPDGERLLTVSTDDTANLWDLSSNGLVCQPLRHGSAVTTARFVGREGEGILTASSDGTARLWDLRLAQGDGLSVHREPGGVHSVLSPDGTKALVRSELGGGSHLRAFELPAGSPVGPRVPIPGEPRSTLLSLDGRRAVTVIDGVGWIWNMTEGGPVGEPLRHPGGDVQDARLSTDGRRAVTWSVDGTAGVWDLETGERLGMVPPDPSKVMSADLDPSGETLAVGHDDGSVRLWDVSTFEARDSQPERMDLSVAVIRFLSADRVLAAATDGEMWVVDVSTGGRPGKVMHHDGWVMDADLSADGRRLVTGSADGTMRVWSLPEGDPVGQPARLGYWVTAVRLSADARSVLTLDMSRRVREWATETGEALGLHSGLRVGDARYLPEDRGWIAAGRDGRITSWNSSVELAGDIDTLADLAEAIAGFEVDDQGVLRWISDPAAHLSSLRERAASADLPAIAWYLEDPWNRALNPGSDSTVDDYIRRRIASFEPGDADLHPGDLKQFASEVRRELAIAFPGHPLLAEPREP